MFGERTKRKKVVQTIGTEDEKMCLAGETDPPLSLSGCLCSPCTQNQLVVKTISHKNARTMPCMSARSHRLTGRHKGPCWRCAGCSPVCDNREDQVYYGLVRGAMACSSWVAWTGHTRFVTQCPEYSKQLAAGYRKQWHKTPVISTHFSTLLVNGWRHIHHLTPY